MAIRRLRKAPAALEVTAFINLIVVLVPFLLSTAVFTRLAVLELNLPAQNAGVEKLQVDQLQLELVLRADAVDVGDRIGGLIAHLPHTAEGPDVRALNALLHQVKAKFPDEKAATLLARPDTPYRTLVALMDATREGRTSRGTEVVKAELFPVISLGDAPQGSDMAKLTPLQKRAARKSRDHDMVDMNLVSLIDVFTILIFFLLSNASEVELLPSSKAVRLPESVAETAPQATLVVTVSAEDIVVEGRRVAATPEALAQTEDLIAPLQAELQRLLAERQAVRAENDRRSVTLMADQELPYQLLRKVMVSCARAGLEDVRFAVRQKAVAS